MNSRYERIEVFVVGLALAFPLLGTFMPLEAYLQPLTFQSIYTQQRVENFNISHAVFMGVAVLCAYLMIVHWRGMLQEARRGALLIVFIGLIFASAAWSVDAKFTILRGFRFLEYWIVALYLSRTFEIVGLTRFLTRVLAVPVFASIAILVARPELGFSNLQGYHDAVRGALVTKNALGALMSVAVLVAGYSFFSRANSRVFALSVLLSSAVLLILSRSATSILATFATTALALYGWMLRRRLNPGWRIMAVILGAIGVGAVIVGAFHLDDVQRIVGRSSTMTGRTDVWRVVLEAIRQRPALGYGYGFWDEASVARDNIWLELNWAPPHAHNTWLDVTLQLGLVGLAITVVLWLIAMWRAARFALLDNQVGALFMALIIVNTFLRSLTETVLIDPGEVYWMWFVIAYLYLARMGLSHVRLPATPATDAIHG